MRKLLHTRTVVCQGYERDDGLWDIEGSITDVKTSDLLGDDGQVWLPAGTPLHRMTLTLTVDASLAIVAAQATTHNAPNAECPAIAPAYAALVGMHIGPGFIGAVKRRLKGRLGCTHLTELIGPIATTAFQTLWKLIERQRKEKEAQTAAAGLPVRPLLLDSCYALRSGGEVAVMRGWIAPGHDAPPAG